MNGRYTLFILIYYICFFPLLFNGKFELENVNICLFSCSILARQTFLFHWRCLIRLLTSVLMFERFQERPKRLTFLDIKAALLETP